MRAGRARGPARRPRCGDARRASGAGDAWASESPRHVMPAHQDGREAAQVSGKPTGMEDGMQTVIRGASRLTVTRSRMAPGSSAGTGGRRTSRLPVEAVQPPCHLFRCGIEAGLPPYAAGHHSGVLAYGPLAPGLLGGTITEVTTFGPGDWRSRSPAFTGPGFRRNLDVVAALGRSAAGRGATIAELAVAWVLAHPAVQVAIVGSRTPAHLEESVGALALTLGRRALAGVASSLAGAVR